MKVSTIASAVLLASSVSAMPEFWKRKLFTEVITVTITAGDHPVTIPANVVHKEVQPTAAVGGSRKNSNSNFQDWIDRVNKGYESRRNRPKRPKTTTVAPPAITSPPVVSQPVETPIIIEKPDKPQGDKEEPPKVEPPKVEPPKVEPPKVEPPKEEEQTGGSSGLGVFAQTALNMHNKYRRKHSAKDLVWDEGLAATAMKWATTNGCQMQHSSKSFRNNAGENLYAKSGKKTSDLVDGTNVDPSEGITDWYNEWKMYNGNYADGVGHFTQVVWKATTKLGCAMPICNMPGLGSNTGFLVCHYSVAGNMMGQFSQNVQGTPSS